MATLADAHDPISFRERKQAPSQGCVGLRKQRVGQLGLEKLFWLNGHPLSTPFLPCLQLWVTLCSWGSDCVNLNLH